jgi:heme/copper-type cytochrome/quinol oxidase subunit 2
MYDQPEEAPGAESMTLMNYVTIGGVVLVVYVVALTFALCKADFSSRFRNREQRK